MGINQPPPFFALDIRFKDRQRTNGASRNSETSVVEGQVCKTPLLLVLVTNDNTSLALRCPAVLPQAQEIQRGIRRRTLTHAAARRPAEEGL